MLSVLLKKTREGCTKLRISPDLDQGLCSAVYMRKEFPNWRRVTVAVGKSIFGIAVCNMCDNFDRLKGRIYAEKHIEFRDIISAQDYRSKAWQAVYDFFNQEKLDHKIEKV